MPDMTFVLLLALGEIATAQAPIVGPIGITAFQMRQPDTSKSTPLGRWANDSDLARLKYAEGKPSWVVLVVMGHPRRIERRVGGSEIWDYPWVSSCRLWFENGVCVGTSYSAGY